MFTDQPVTPARLETLVEVVRHLQNERRTVHADLLCNLLQPDGLEQVDSQRLQSRKAIQTARELELISNDGDRFTLSAEAAVRRGDVRDAVLAAFDRKVLSDTHVEPYFAKFYSYLLASGSTTAGKNHEAWARDFNRDVFGDQPVSNPFNKEKLTGMNRWMRWAGLGWYDPSDEFNCNPYDRVRRALPAVFGTSHKLDDEAFIAALGRECPELDTGAIFTDVAAAAAHNRSDHLLSLGLAQTLLELHDDKLIRLHAARDAEGWGLEQADPAGLDGPRLHAVELLQRN